MSCITDALVIAAHGDAPCLYRVRLADGQRLQPVSPFAGGSKVMASTVWAAGFNHLDCGELVAALEQLDFAWPERVHLLLRHEDDDRFVSVPLRLRGVCPEQTP